MDRRHVKRLFLREGRQDRPEPARGGKRVASRGPHEQHVMPQTSCSVSFYQRQNSPENKLLKLSSAALELSSLEDRKFYDFLNEKSNDNHTPISTDNSLDDNGSEFSKVVGVNFNSEFSETSSNKLLPQLFEDF